MNYAIEAKHSRLRKRKREEENVHQTHKMFVGVLGLEGILFAWFVGRGCSPFVENASIH
jgi:hypothetical protein